MSSKLFPKFFFAFLLLTCGFAEFGFTQKVYYPASENWERRTPEQARINAAKLKEAIDFAIRNESKAPRNLELAHYQIFGREPFGEAVGAFKERGDATGIIIRNGYIIAEWGDPQRVDMTFSVTKSFLSTVVGLAFDRKLVKNLQAPVYQSVAPISVYNTNEKSDNPEKFGKSPFLELFETEHNRQITWEHLLRQTSDWEGTLWGKPDWADRPDTDANNWLNRKRNAPGAVYEYNDVRVNVLALAALNVWRKPLPQVLKENVMDEIGASNTWRWFGYENSWIVLDGAIVQSVSGGGHWGGGMFINARDMARFGLLTRACRRPKPRCRPVRILNAEYWRDAPANSSVLCAPFVASAQARDFLQQF
ncbi:MAG: serine hydrolase [Acidobacteria bacterium]|nr:serine hydrolase [Acidobacteriota bacterium]